jgi:DNA-binding NarL/FixJ family response regulator
MIRVVLVDDHPGFRWITRRLLTLDPEVEVVGEAGNGVEALDVVAQVQPDVVLMDVQMPLLDGIATTRRLRVTCPDVQIVLFTASDDGAALDGVRAGAVRYLCKTTRQEELVAVLRRACAQSM